MSPEQSSEPSIFNHARKIESSDDRRAYLKEACGQDAALRQRIEKLLSAYAAQSQFLEQPAVELDATIMADASADLAASLQAGLAPTFGKDAAVVVGSASHSVLKSLGQTIDHVPRVVLHDAAEQGDAPIERPRSPEIPERDADSRYQLQGEIARGGMGAIIKGRDTDLGRDLAIKVLLDSHKDKPEVIQRFVEEAQIGGQLQHPGIAPVYELGQFADNRPFFSMKLVKGKTLSALLGERAEPADDRAKLLKIFEQVCQTMAYAHSRGVIHRDLKPANIMVGAFGEVQVMDWGLAKVLSAGGVADEKKAHTRHKDASIIQTMRSVGSDAPGTLGSVGSQTQMGSVMGTPAYMPPEQALGEIDRLDERADVFGLGAILCEILTGKPPYVGEDATQVFRQASRGKLDDCFIRLHECSVEQELTDLVTKTLAVEPEQRLRNASAVADGVTRYLAGVQERLKAAELAGAEANARAEHATRRRKLVIAIAGLMVLLAAGSGFSALEFRQQREDQAALAMSNLQLAEDNDKKRIEAENARETIRIEKQKVEEQKEKLQHEQYVSDMHLVQRAHNDGTIGRVHELLEKHIPVVGETDRRGFEWYYWWRNSHLELQSVEQKGIPFFDLVVSPNQNYFALHSWHGHLEIRDAATLRVTAIARVGTEFDLRMAFSGDSDLLATIAPNESKRVRLWDTDEGKLNHTSDLNELSPIQLSHKISAIAFSPSESRLAVADEGGMISFWNAQTGNPTESSLNCDFSITQLAFSSDGSLLAALTSSNQKDDVVLIYDLADGELKTTLKGRQRTATSLAWSRAADRDFIAMGSADGDVCLWSGESFEYVDTLAAIGHIDALTFSPDGSRLAARMYRQAAVQVWQVDSSRLITTIRGHESMLEGAGFIEGGESLVSTGSEGVLKKWDLSQARPFFEAGSIHETGSQERWRWLFGRDRPVRRSTVALLNPSELFDETEVRELTGLSDNGQYLAVLKPDGDHTRRLEVWQASEAEPRLIRERNGIPAMPVPAVDIAVSSDGSKVVWTIPGWNEAADHPAVQGWLVIFNVETGQLWAKPIPRIRCVALSADGDYLAAMDGHMTRTWVLDISDSTVPKSNFEPNREWWLRHELAHQLDTGIGIQCAFSPDGQQVAIATTHTDIVLVDARTRKEMFRLRGHAGVVTSLAFSRDGSLLASGGVDGTIRLWDPESGQLRTTLVGHKGEVASVVFSEDAAGRQTITSLDRTGRILIWPAATKAEVERHPRFWEARANRSEELLQQNYAGQSSERAIALREQARQDFMRAAELQPRQLLRRIPTPKSSRIHQGPKHWAAEAMVGRKNVDLTPDDSIAWLRLAAVLAPADDEAAYREFCRRMVQQFGGKDLLSPAEHTCKACLLLPDVIDVSQLPIATVVTALDEGTAPRSYTPWAWGTRALVAYRSGDAELAMRYVQRSEGLNPADFAHAFNLAIRSMARCQLGNLEMVLTDAQQCAQAIDKIIKTDASRGNHHDMLIAKILLREANALIDDADQKPIDTAMLSVSPGSPR